MQQNLDWLPMPADIERGSKAKTMALPAIRPPQYANWRDFQQAWFWNLFWASMKYGGYLPAGSELWQTAGALTRARWDANCAAVLAAFGCTQPDADGRFSIYYPPLLEILFMQQKKYRKKIEPTLSETSTESHREGEGYSLSIPLSFDFDLDSKNQDQNIGGINTQSETSAAMGNEHKNFQGKQGPGHPDVKTAAKRILDILTLPDNFLADATAAVEIKLKSKVSVDEAVAQVTTDANLAERKRISHEEFLQDFQVRASARRILEMLNLPISDNSVLRLTAVVKAEIKDTGLSIEETAAHIARAAIEDRSRGMAVNIFYFEDVKWRSNGRASKAEQRKLDNLAASERAREILRQRRG